MGCRLSREPVPSDQKGQTSADDVTTIGIYTCVERERPMMNIAPDGAALPDGKPESKAKGKGSQIGRLLYTPLDLEQCDSDPGLMNTPKEKTGDSASPGKPSPRKAGYRSCSAQNKLMQRSQPARRVKVDSGVDPTCGVSTELKYQDRGGSFVAISDKGELYIFGDDTSCTLAVRTQQYMLVRNAVGILPEGEVVTLHRQADQQKRQDEAYFIAGDTVSLQVVTESLELNGNWKSVTNAHWRPLKYSDVFNSPHDPSPPSPDSFILQYWSTQYQTESPKDPNALFFYIESGSKTYFKLGSLNKAKLYGVFEWDALNLSP